MAGRHTAVHLQPEASGGSGHRHSQNMRVKNMRVKPEHESQAACSPAHGQSQALGTSLRHGSDLSLGRDREQEQKEGPTPNTGPGIILLKGRVWDGNCLFCSEYLQITEKAGGEIPGKP